MKRGLLIAALLVASARAGLAAELPAHCQNLTQNLDQLIAAAGKGELSVLREQIATIPAKWQEETPNAAEFDQGCATLIEGITALGQHDKPLPEACQAFINSIETSIANIPETELNPEAVEVIDEMRGHLDTLRQGWYTAQVLSVGDQELAQKSAEIFSQQCRELHDFWQEIQ